MKLYPPPADLSTEIIYFSTIFLCFSRFRVLFTTIFTVFQTKVIHRRAFADCYTPEAQKNTRRIFGRCNRFHYSVFNISSLSLSHEGERGKEKLAVGHTLENYRADRQDKTRAGDNQKHCRERVSAATGLVYSGSERNRDTDNKREKQCGKCFQSHIRTDGVNYRRADQKRRRKARRDRLERDHDLCRRSEPFAYFVDTLVFHSHIVQYFSAYVNATRAIRFPDTQKAARPVMTSGRTAISQKLFRKIIILRLRSLPF